jgi:hypothetical protein
MGWISVLICAIGMFLMAGIVVFISMGERSTLSIGSAGGVISMIGMLGVVVAREMREQEQRISRLEKRLEEKNGQESI